MKDAGSPSSTSLMSSKSPSIKQSDEPPPSRGMVIFSVLFYLVAAIVVSNPSFILSEIPLQLYFSLFLSSRTRDISVGKRSVRVSNAGVESYSRIRRGRRIRREFGVPR